MREINDEIKALALQAIENETYHILGEVIAAARKAAHGLNTDQFDDWLSDLDLSVASVAMTDDFWISDCGTRDQGYYSLLGALQDELSEAVCLEGNRKFEIRNGEWHYVGDQK